MPPSIQSVVTELEKPVPSDNTEAQRLKPSEPKPSEAEIAAVEQRLGQKYPPSFRDLLRTHGQFTIGTASSSAYKTWPLEEHQTALARAADELECDATAKAVADELGLRAKTVAVLEQIVLVGGEYDDFVGFDLRTRNTETGECAFTLQLMDDLEIEYLAKEKSKPCKERGFDAWLLGYLERRR